MAKFYHKRKINMKRILNADTINYLNKEAKVCGWVNSIRAHGNILFVDLRDRSGIIQLVFSSKNETIYKLAEKVRPEWVIEVTGKISERPVKMINPKIKTGKIELLAENLEVLSNQHPCRDYVLKHVHMSKIFSKEW